MNNGSPPPLVLVDYDYSHAGGRQPTVAGGSSTSGSGKRGSKGGGTGGDGNSGSSKRGGRSKASNSIISYSEASELGREALLDARMAKAKELAAAGTFWNACYGCSFVTFSPSITCGEIPEVHIPTTKWLCSPRRCGRYKTGEARLAALGPEGVASERAALRAKLREQQRAAEAATSEAYNQERASEAQDAATQKEADRGRQRAAEVQRRKDADAAAATAAELVGQQQPVIGCLSLPIAGSVLLSIYSL